MMRSMLNHKSFSVVKACLVSFVKGIMIILNRILWFGNEGGYTAMVMDLLGSLLGTLLSMCGGWFTTKCVLMLGAQLVCLNLFRRCSYLIYLPRDITARIPPFMGLYSS
jgi:hypothetical protein